ncbi:mechanosensitive ion channel [Komagataeibacter rhaeticus]|nr:mechanosensitive ion channel [Komagataeibacter rhaeticus]
MLLALIIIIVAVTTLSQIGINVAPLLTGAGIMGAAIAFGAQSLVKDFITGFSCWSKTPFRWATGLRRGCRGYGGTPVHPHAAAAFDQWRPAHHSIFGSLVHRQYIA